MTDAPMTHAEVDALARDHGPSFFVLDGDRFAANFAALHRAFADPYGEVRIGYSYKTNYTPQLCRIVDRLGGHAEVVSEMEYAHARRLGIAGKRIIFNGPVKADWAFAEAALSGATLNLDNMRDVAMLRDLAGAHPDRDVAVVIRVNFPIGPAVSRFGMDTEGTDFRDTLALIAATPNLMLKGLHCHFPDRDLDSFKTRAQGMVALMRQVFPDAPPEIVNIGGGYFSHMPASLRARFDTPPASFEDYGAAVGAILSRAFDGAGRKPVLFLEPGTAIVADTQVFYTEVLSTKIVRGKRFAIVAGSAFDISPTARSRTLPVTPVLAEPRPGGDPHDVVGFTCIEGDVLTEGLTAPLRPGDYLCYGNVGSYSVVMRPPFILPSNPILYREGAGPLQPIKRRQSNEDVFRDFTF